MFSSRLGGVCFLVVCVLGVLAGCGTPPVEAPAAGSAPEEAASSQPAGETVTAESAVVVPPGKPATGREGLWFRDAAEESGLKFLHINGAAGRFYMPEVVGSGVALLDFDGDGDLDVLLIQGDVVAGPARGTGHRLFRNEFVPSGVLKFTDVTAGSGLGQREVGMGVAVGDFDNDGRPDVYLTSVGPNRLFRNLGNGKFEDVTAKAAVSEGRWSTSAVFLDYDRDGWQDLYVANYVDFNVTNQKNCKSPLGMADYCGPQVYNGLTDRLFRNLGNGRFEDVTAKAGIAQAPGPGLGVTPFDANGDGWLDLYVANDGKPNHLWVNQKDGTFVEEGLQMGAAMAESGVPRAGMGVAVADLNNDGRPHVVVTNLTNEGATLYGSEGETGFFDVSHRHGVNRATFPKTGFGVGWFDALNRGRLDLFIANGAVKLEPGVPAGVDPYRQANQLLRNEAGKLVDVSGKAGPGPTGSMTSSPCCKIPPRQ
jgi:enediyne biosynthesis protein E4